MNKGAAWYGMSLIQKIRSRQVTLKLNKSEVTSLAFLLLGRSNELSYAELPAIYPDAHAH